MTTRMCECMQILDDGEYYVELKGSVPPAGAAGFLQRRCYVGVTTPGGYECVGSFERNDAGNWQASIDTAFDPKTDRDSRSLGEHPTRLDAIAALWSARREAFCRHRE